MVPVEMGHGINSLRTITIVPIKTDEDAVSDHGRLHPNLNHLLEEAQACSQVANFYTAVQERVVDQLIASQPTLPDLLEHLKCLVHLSNVAITLQECGEGDEVRL